MTEEIEIKRFDVNNISFDNFILIIASRFSGKSTLIRDIFYKLRKKYFPYGIVFNSSESCNSHYSEFIPEALIHEHYNKDALEKLIKYQEKKLQKLPVEERKKPEHGVFVIFDDMQYDKESWKNDTTFKKIVFNGRHLNMFVILALQEFKGINSDLRKQADYTFLFNTKNFNEREQYYKNFASNYDKNVFYEIFDKCTQNMGECLVTYQRIFNKHIPQLSYYQSKIRPTFHVCSPSVWKFYEKIKNNESSDEDNKERLERNTKRGVVKIILNRGKVKQKLVEVTDTSDSD